MNQGISQFDEPSGAAQASGESYAGAEDVGMDPRPLVPSTLLAPVQSPSHLLPESGISQELRRVNRALAALRACNQAQARAANEQELLDQICDIIVRIGGYRMAGIAYAQADEEKTVRPRAHAGYDSGYLDKIEIKWSDTPAGRGPSGTTIREN